MAGLASPLHDLLIQMKSLYRFGNEPIARYFCYTFVAKIDSMHVLIVSVYFVQSHTISLLL